MSERATEPVTRRPRVGVLLSGRGSNYEALQAAVDDGFLPVELVLVLSNETAAEGLEKARRHGVPAVAIPHRAAPSRRAHEEQVLAELAAARVDWICLAGYMRLLSSIFIGHFENRVLNIHPSLLPAFPGLQAQEQAIQHGVRVSGCTVHLVDAGLDTGPIVVQRAVPVEDGDDVATLAARILEQEHRAYPEALRMLVTRRWRIDGRRLQFERNSPSDLDRG